MNNNIKVFYLNGTTYIDSFAGDKCIHTQELNMLEALKLAITTNGNFDININDTSKDELYESFIYLLNIVLNINTNIK